MPEHRPYQGAGTLVTHLGEYNNPYYAHVMPIYQSATFCFPDVDTGAATFRGEQEGYIYTRLGNPNTDLLARKIAALEGLELLRSHPDRSDRDLVAGLVFASGMAAISTAIMARARAGDTIIAQAAVYGNTYLILQNIAPRLGLRVVWVSDPSPKGWQVALADHPEAVLLYAESPVNPTMAVVDLAAAAELAHQHSAWLYVDNTFATPYCQRPLALGADVVLHSTTKYLTGHGAVIGGAVASTQLDFMRGDLLYQLKYLGSTPSPFDCWLTNQGLKTFQLRMQRHCENATRVAQFLDNHQQVAAVHYPGLASHPGHAVACRQMAAFGGMLSFELRGGYAAGVSLMNKVRVATLAVSLGNLDTLIQHPASMTHSTVPRLEREQMGISDGLVRLSVGIEDIDDLLNDLDQALS